jgi:hypothetical protein
MSTAADVKLVGELSNNSRTYHLPNPVHLNKNTNYTITHQQVYPHWGHFGAKYPGATQMATIGEISDPDYSCNGLGQLFMEDVV